MAKKRDGANDVMPSVEVLRKYADDYETETSDAAKANQGLGTLKKNAEKQHNIHWSAFKRAMRLRKMSETDRAAELRHFMHYVRSFKLADQDDLFLGPVAAGVPSARDGAALDEIETAAMQ